jgi:hypothetical protein
MMTLGIGDKGLAQPVVFRAFALDEIKVALDLELLNLNGYQLTVAQFAQHGPLGQEAEAVVFL